MGAVSEELEQRLEMFIPGLEKRGHARFAAHKLRPGRVEQVIGQSINARGQPEGTAGAVRGVRGLLRIAYQQVEAVVA